MKISGKLLGSAVIAALSGFLFGFDTVVISGAEQKIQALWQLTDTVHGLALSAALWGTVLGSIVGAYPTDRFGRKPTLLCIGILYLVSAIWSALAANVYFFFIARFIGGMGIGIATVAAPLYITEIAPPEARGRLTGMFQFNIVFGILIAFVSNWLLKGTGEADWRWMLGIVAIPALVYTILCLRIPESPRWLINVREDRAAGLDVLRKLNPTIESAQLATLADAMAHHMGENAQRRAATTPFWSSRLRYPISIAFLVAFFNQLSGINAILYFAPRILGMTGLEGKAAFIQTIGIGVTNLIFTMLGLWLIDRLGRRKLLYVGSFGYIASLGLIAAMFIKNEVPFRVATDALSTRDAYAKLAHAEQSPNLTASDVQALRENAAKSLSTLNATFAKVPYDADKTLLPPESSAEQIEARTNQVVADASSQAGGAGRFILWGIFAFIAAHAIGQGTVIWVLISEVFPNEHRAQGQSLGSATHWVFAALLTLVFPSLVSLFWPGYVFAFFCFMMILQLLWVATMVPETRGVPLEELQKQLHIA